MQFSDFLSEKGWGITSSRKFYGKIFSPRVWQNCFTDKFTSLLIFNTDEHLVFELKLLKVDRVVFSEIVSDDEIFQRIVTLISENSKNSSIPTISRSVEKIF